MRKVHYEFQKGGAMKTPRLFLLLTISMADVGLSPILGFSATCVDCHKNTTPNIVSDWQLSKHGQSGIDCAVCHGQEHASASDVAKAKIPTPDTCAACHDDKVQQYRRGNMPLPGPQ